MDFFKELPHFIVKAGPILSNIYGADWENRLEVLIWLRFYHIIKKGLFNIPFYLYCLVYLSKTEFIVLCLFLCLFLIYQAKELQANFVHLSILSRWLLFQLHLLLCLLVYRSILFVDCSAGTIWLQK